MTEERFNRIEDLMAQLIRMVGNVSNELHELKASVNKTSTQIDDIKSSIDYLVHKSGEHDRDIFVLKRKRLDDLTEEANQQASKNS